MVSYGGMRRTDRQAYGLLEPLSEPPAPASDATWAVLIAERKRF
jgi:hypothetical protein